MGSPEEGTAQASVLDRQLHGLLAQKDGLTSTPGTPGPLSGATSDRFPGLGAQPGVKLGSAALDSATTARGQRHYVGDTALTRSEGAATA